MEYGREGPSGDLAQGQSGGSGVRTEFVYQAARDFDGEGNLGIADRNGAFELERLLEVAIGLARGDGASLGEKCGGIGQVRVVSQQGARQIEPLGLLGIAGAGHMSYIYALL